MEKFEHSKVAKYIRIFGYVLIAAGIITAIVGPIYFSYTYDVVEAEDSWRSYTKYETVSTWQWELAMGWLGYAFAFVAAGAASMGLGIITEAANVYLQKHSFVEPDDDEYDD